jgi:dolichyl-diphosphooligosaccharide--protein glycosyltransferase/undecaprenyl-diphosphooligosaccharide--protein glycosyltransferase
MASYYYRTHLGYYDTDMLNLFFPLLSIYFLIRLVDSRKIVYGVFGIFSLILFHLWYHSSTSIIISIVITFIVYILIFERKSKYYRYYFFSFITISIILFSITDISQYFNRADDYINKQSWIEIASKNGIVKLRGDLEIVSEARAINFATLAHRVSDGKTFFIIACLGYLALLLKYRSMILTLPLILILFISLFAGLRFTIYGVPLFAFTLLYGIGLIFKIVFRNSKYSKKLVNIAIKIFLIVIVTISINNIVRYNKKLSPFYFSSADDIKALNKLKEISTPNSFIIAPWDYGWLLWYYSNIGTIVDNGKHGEDNYIVSKILLSNNQQFVRNASLFFINKYKKNSLSKIMTPFLKEYSIDYIKNMEENSFKLSNGNKDVYILLHIGMLNTYESIEEASNIDIKTGKRYPSNLYNRILLSKRYDNTQKLLKTTTQLSIDIEHGRILSTKPNEDADVKEIIIKNGSNIEFRKSYNTPNNIYIVIYGENVLIMNKKLYNSFLIQALLLNNYNHNLFDEIGRDDNLLILRVK